MASPDQWLSIQARHKPHEPDPTKPQTQPNLVTFVPPNWIDLPDCYYDRLQDVAQFERAISHLRRLRKDEKERKKALQEKPYHLYPSYEYRLIWVSQAVIAVAEDD